MLWSPKHTVKQLLYCTYESGCWTVNIALCVCVCNMGTWYRYVILEGRTIRVTVYITYEYGLLKEAIPGTWAWIEFRMSGLSLGTRFQCGPKTGHRSETVLNNNIKCGKDRLLQRCLKLRGLYFLLGERGENGCHLNNGRQCNIPVSGVSMFLLTA